MLDNNENLNTETNIDEKRPWLYWVKFFIVWSYFFVVCYWLLVTNGNLLDSFIINPLYFYIYMYFLIFGSFVELIHFIIDTGMIINTTTKEQAFLIGIYLSFLIFIALYFFCINEENYNLVTNQILAKFPWLVKLDQLAWYSVVGYIIFLFIKNSV